MIRSRWLIKASFQKKITLIQTSA